MQSYKYVYVHGLKPSNILTSMYFVLYTMVVALLHKILKIGGATPPTLLKSGEVAGRSLFASKQFRPSYRAMMFFSMICTVCTVTL